MSGTKQENVEADAEEADRDDALDDTFPASDPISIGGSTGPEDVEPE